MRDLKKILDLVPDNTPIVMSKDAEGNGFSPLTTTSYGSYEAESTWAGEYSDDRERYPLKVLALWPTN